MEKKRNNFLDGFVIGAAIGSVAVFLLGTKKGREVLKIIREEGKERFERLENMFSAYEEAMGEEDMEEYGDGELASGKESKMKTTLRKRLFKGVPKKK